MASSPEAKSLESRIDDLYRLPLSAFVGGRNELAKSLPGAEAARVRKLPKPTLVPWTINQLYWRARPAYDQLMDAGERLRLAQVAALAGKKADVRSAMEAHRRAVAGAAEQAGRFAAAEGPLPSPEVQVRLTRALEAFSLAPKGSEPAGRLTHPPGPAGFEALAGVTVRAQPPAARQASAATLKQQEAARKKLEAARKKHAAALKRAEAAVERARRRMQEAQEALRRTRDQAS